MTSPTPPGDETPGRTFVDADLHGARFVRCDLSGAVVRGVLDRVAGMPPGTVDVSVDGEWSFAQTLRHLVMATDDLAGVRSNPWVPQHPETVLSCLHTILEEEWEHLRYGVRDLDAVQAGLER